MNLFPVSILVMVLAIFASVAMADKRLADKSKAHTGVVVSVSVGKLVMTSEGKEHSHDISDTAKITLNGKESKLADLKKGDKVLVTTTEAGHVEAVAATRVEASPRS